MPAKVSLTDGEGVTHTVCVSASSLYEAAILGIADFRRCGFAVGTVGPGTRLKVAVERPATTHEFSVGKLQAWLDSSGKTPREQATKAALRELMGLNPPTKPPPTK